ncbi:hypothetical protein [Rhizorhapis sp. SPR117]|uniref:hypothetical protein n=1 Tax=Rhizorhapis sp. SPR117 TaxID=2912611 RepID=UPI00403EA3BC
MFVVKLPPEERTAAAILNALDFDFFELLDSVTIARSRKHIQTFYSTEEVGKFPERLKPISFHCPLTGRPDVIGLNEIFDRLTMLKLAVYAPVSYILPSRIGRYAELYDTEVKSGGGTLRQADRERSLQALMTVNLLKRLESSVEAFRITLGDKSLVFFDRHNDHDRSPMLFNRNRFSAGNVDQHAKGVLGILRRHGFHERKPPRVFGL